MSGAGFWRVGDAVAELPKDGRVGKLHPPEWMRSPAARAVIAALEADGGAVRFVGGCVRDALLKRPVTDIDLATPLEPEAVMQRLRDAGIKVIPTGLDHGTVTAVAEGQPFEITTLRVDVETDGRHARVAFTDDWRADAARRDFTVNALSCTPDGDIYDYFNGIADAAHGRVCFVGPPGRRIEEDALRILRFFRFHAQFGQPPIDTDGLHACRAHAAEVDTLSGERLRVELMKTLLAPDPTEAVALMRDARVLPRLVPEPLGVDRLRSLVWLESRAIKRPTIAPDWIRRLAALTHAPALACKAMAERLRLANAETGQLITLAMRQPPVDADAPPHRLHQAIYRLGGDRARDLALLAWADELTRTPRAHHAAWTQVLDVIDTWRRPALPVAGADIVALGVPEGPAVGEHLRAVETWWEAGDYQADRAACLAFLKARIAGETDCR